MSAAFSGTSLSAALGLVLLAIVPLALVTLTSFAKIAVVLSALRNAIGAPDVPSGAIVTALALALTVYVMAPVGTAIEQRAATFDIKAGASVEALLAAAADPVRAFLARHAGAAEKRMFVELAKERGTTASEADLSVLWASFALSEMKRAFELAFFLFLPFLVLDLVVAHVLLATGLHGLTPANVALPFKLLLFVSVDGWLLVSRALVLGYS